MSEENKAEEAKEDSKAEESRGDRGELGTATAGLTIRQMYHDAHFIRQSANDKHNPNRRVFIRKEGPAVSLKQFARQLLKDGNPVAKEWFANKRGAKNQKRSDANVKAAREAGAATKAKRLADSSKKKKG